MGMRVERRVCVELWVASAVLLVSLAAKPANAADTRPARRATSAEADEGPTQKGRGVRVGALAGVGFPRPLTIEGVIGVERALAVGAEYGFMPESTIGGIDMTLWSLAGDARIFPFRGPFFVGLRGGHQRFGASATASLGSYGSVSETLTVDTWFVNPRIGALWMWDSWLAVGIEAGVQIPLSSSVSSSLPPNLPDDPRITNARQTLTRVTDALGSTALPTIDLLRIGLVL
jgi:hypothetical protein